jgi:hypothetical protein
MYGGSLGYSQLSVWIKEWSADPGTGSEADKALEEWLHAMILGRASNKEKVVFGDVQSYTVGQDLFHSIIYRDSTLEGRLDVVEKHGKLIAFYLIVPSGLLDSGEMKQVIKSYAVH